MATIKDTFICPACGSGINTTAGQRPEACPGCRHKFGTVRKSVYRLPKPLIQQYRERLKMRIAAIPPMPNDKDTPEAGRKDARARYDDEQKANILGEEQEHMRQCIIGMSEEYIKDTIDSFVRMVVTSSQLSEPTRRYLSAMLPHCTAVIETIQKGYSQGVDYGTQNARPLPGDPDLIDTGARGVPSAGERDTGSTGSK